MMIINNTEADIDRDLEEISKLDPETEGLLEKIRNESQMTPDEIDDLLNELTDEEDDS